MVNYKIIRGYYLTGTGQEPEANYFKVSANQPEFQTIQAGDVAVTFYQNKESITSLPALIRVDSVIVSPKLVNDFLKGEKKDHLPMLPIVSLYEKFEPLSFNRMMESFDSLRADIQRLAKVKAVQGDLFEDFVEEGIL